MFSLNGKFRINVYNQNGELNHSTDYLNNFITSSGLSYPYDAPFPECFKYLSIGSGTGINTLLTTGLSYVNTQFSSMGSYVNGACGSNETSSGLNHYKAWLVSGITSPLTINELGVSPAPVSGGYISGVLFSRIVTPSPITISSGDYSIITYRLDIAAPTGLGSFANIINTAQVNSVNNPVCRYWNTLSGIYSVVHNGLRTISSAGITNVPTFGDPLEPSNRDTTNLIAYLSTDNQQFTVNSWSGGKISTGLFQPWNPNGKPLGTGVCAYHNTLDTFTSSRIINIRRDTHVIPDSGNFTNEINKLDFQKNSSITTITPDSYVSTGRSRSITRLFSWPNVSNQFQDIFGNDRRVKSLVLSYGTTTYYPYVDMLFATSGLIQTFSPVDTNAYTYSGASITGDYVFIDSYNNLSLSFRLGWSAPCPSNVSGC